MSKIIYVVARNTETKVLSEKIKVICDSLNPDNIVATPSEVKYEDGIALGLSNPSDILQREETNIVFGQLLVPDPQWKIPGGPKPDGNYAIFRSSSENVEIVTDILGTKAIWYYKDEDYFVASSSQRALIKFLGEFDFNPEVIPWMVCNGFLGPGQSWDKRLSLIPPDSILQLDRQSWKLSITSEEVVFKPNKKTDQENFREFKNTLDNLFSRISFDYSKWKLTLSGGYDSRGILLALPTKDQENKSIETITWGLKDAKNRSGNDAFIARKIAEQLGVSHNYFSTDQSTNEPLQVVLNRYLKNGEGRIDHLGGYLDGFAIWKTLYENNVKGIIRGDEVFGSYNFATEFHLKKFIGLSLPNDYENLKRLEYFKELNISLPEKFEKRDEESLEMWRDRLYQIHLVPIFLSALEDLKQPYLEQVNPLLSKTIVKMVREMPDHLRTEKKLFKKYVNSFPELAVSYARESAIKTMKDIFGEPALVDLIKEELNSSSAQDLFDADFVYQVLAQIKSHSENSYQSRGLTKKIKKLIPKEWKKYLLKQAYTPKADMNMVGFRLFMISKMNKLLEQDSRSIDEHIID